MACEHSWTRISHDFFGFLPLFGLVAVDWAVGAGRLLLLKRAPVKAHLGVFEEGGAFWA
jgi:hypothetical protein